MKIWKALALAAGLALPGATGAAAQGALVVYCGVDEAWCRAMSTAFERETGIKVSMTRKSAGEIYAQLRAEAENPKADIWWGGTGDPHLQAAGEGLTLEYTSPKMGELQDWAVRHWEAAGHRSVGIYSGALGFGYNSELVKTDPKCWADLVDAKYKGEVQVADPNSSGTAWTMLATIVQLMGEEKAFEWLKGLNKNVNQYTKSGSAPAQAAARGETGVAISFQHDLVTMVVNGAPIKVIAPCEGTGYEIGGMSIIKGAKNLDNAKKWYDWALTPAAQKIAAEAKSYQVPSNKETPTPPQAPKLNEIKLIDYDFKTYGSPETRKRLLARWDSEVKNQPK